ncbi:MAG TPA: hypothetical protein VIW24_15905 [Aldersonia sp.]
MNVLVYLGIVILPSATLWLVCALPSLCAKIADRARSRRPHATSRPIERLAADLRRVDLALRNLPPGSTMVRRRATEQAYDDLLREACRALDVPDRLDTVPTGLDRELERARVQRALQRAGLAIR